MSTYASICFIVSSATPTTMSSEVPVRYRVSCPVNLEMKIGTTAINPRKIAPTSVRRSRMRVR